MAPDRPSWVIKDLTSILSLDEETVSQLLVPEFEVYTSQAKLMSHLQDFLGSSPAAKAFIDRYLSLRFPSLSTPSTSIPPPQPASSKPSKPPSRVSTPNLRASATVSTPAPSRAETIPDALDAAFGPGGKVYQKNRDADASLWGSAPGSAGGSGSHTPAHGHSHHGPTFGRPGQRAGGAVIIRTESGKGKERESAGGSGGAKGGEGGKGKEKGQGRIWDLPKSAEVKRLEGIVGDLRQVQSAEGKVKVNPTACFCQARVHGLSIYNPHCPHCGLILCSLHQPHHACPSCHQPVLSPSSLARLILRVQSDIDAQLAKEQADREEEKGKRLAEMQAQAAFPYLGGVKHSGVAGMAAPTPREQGRKVLTIGTKGKGKGKATATLTTTYSRPTPTPSPGPSTPLEPQIPDDIVPRPRSAPLEAVKSEKELNKMLVWREGVDRPWGDMQKEKKGEVWSYVPLPVLVGGDEEQVGRRKGRKKGKASVAGIGVDGRVVVGAAG